MSESLRAYLIADERDLHVFGCRRGNLLEEVLEVLADRLADYDEQADVEQNQRISHAQALRELFAGRLTRLDCGPIYGWTYELYCSSMGERLHCNPFSPCRYGWFEQLDGFLAGHLVPLRFAKLLDDCPIPLPEARELPCVGHWLFDEIKTARELWAGAIEQATDPRVVEALSVVGRWLEKTTRQSG